jgi:hypothetical protein
MLMSRWMARRAEARTVDNRYHGGTHCVIFDHKL